MNVLNIKTSVIAFILLATCDKTQENKHQKHKSAMPACIPQYTVDTQGVNEDLNLVTGDLILHCPL